MVIIAYHSNNSIIHADDGAETILTRSHPPTERRLSAANRVLRVLWAFTWLFLYRPSPRPLHGWRRMLLRIFGATIGARAHPYPRAKIWAPWNLTIDAAGCIADDVDCYCVAPVRIGAHATVSQYSYLCTASHDFRDPSMPLVAAPIEIGAEAWVAADVFVGPGVTVGEGAVIGARSTVVRDVDPWTVVAGSPAVRRGERPRFVRAG
ncbi:MAG: putative colanic acid biosynthesis acetyltransferase [Gammaproteobacteria bacterium]|nr:putative colanic acid biosynthesis acetyltransferase [Gammaproteobacteria bacterium]